MAKAPVQRRTLLFGLAAAAVASTGSTSLAQGNALPSWNDGAARTAILEFVARTTTAGTADYVPVAERIALRPGRRSG